jgi:hypothetical protein
MPTSSRLPWLLCQGLISHKMTNKVHFTIAGIFAECDLGGTLTLREQPPNSIFLLYFFFQCSHIFLISSFLSSSSPHFLFSLSISSIPPPPSHHLLNLPPSSPHFLNSPSPPIISSFLQFPPSLISSIPSSPPTLPIHIWSKRLQIRVSSITIEINSLQKSCNGLYRNSIP